MHVGTRSRSLLIGAAALALAARTSAWADDAPDPTAPPSSSTDVKGTPPVDMRGLWLLIGHGGLMSQGKVAANKVRTSVELWRIDGHGDAIAVEPWLHDLPANWRETLDQANAHFQSWTPSDDEIADLAQQLESLQAQDPDRYLKHLFTLVAPDHYSETDLNTGGLDLDGSVMTMRVQHQYRPQPVSEQPQAQLMSDDAVYVVHKAEATRLEGEHTRLVLAAGFLPIPVSTQGEFTMYRLRGADTMPKTTSAAGGTGWLSRVWDSLSRGCK